MELDPKLVDVSRTKAKKEGMRHLVEFREQGALAVDVSHVTVVTLYLLPQVNNKLKPNRHEQLRPGSRVVSHDFDIDGWSPKKVPKFCGRLFHRHTVYVSQIEDQPN